MATYDECLQAIEDSGLRRKVRVACAVAADTIRAEGTGVTNHTARLAWAKLVFANPEAQTPAMLWAVVIQNRASTFAQIVGATDAQVQTAVNAAVDVLT